VFNRSENPTVFKMPSSFRGFVQADGCGYFHQLNPVNIEVGSAIAEHFSCIRLRCLWS
jgi:hypothetical protein